MACGVFCTRMRNGNMPDETDPTAPGASTTEPAPLPPGYVFDHTTGQPRPMTFMERARHAAGAAAVAAAKMSVEVGSQAARAGADLGGRAAHATAETMRDPATKAKALEALNKAKQGLSTAKDRLDSTVIGDAADTTSPQDDANASGDAKASGDANASGDAALDKAHDQG